MTIAITADSIFCIAVPIAMAAKAPATYNGASSTSSRIEITTTRALRKGATDQAASQHNPSAITPIEENYGEAPINSPEDTVKLLAERKGLRLDEIKTPEIVFLSLSAGTTEPLVKAVRGKERKWLYRARPLFVGEVNGKQVGVIWAAPGAPLAAMTMEDLVACGSKVFIGIGLASAIQPYVGFGDLILPNFAVRDEGTSYHYLPGSHPAVPSAGILRALKKSCEKSSAKSFVGPIWSNDAPYRETRSKVRYYSAKGVLGVDMESSTLFTVAAHRRVCAGCILIASSNLNSTKNGIGFYSERLADSVAGAIDCALEATRILIRSRNQN
jgi:uridine phosphorylase